jgi:hypothetical protein
MKCPLFTATVLLLGIGTNLNAQSSFWNSGNAYLGQKPPSDTPKLFAPGLLAGKGEFAIDRIAFSGDGKEIYYCTNTSWFSGANLKIRYLKFDGKKWDGPNLLNEHYSAPTFSSDGKTFYFTGRTSGVVWQSHRTANGWSEPSEYIRRNYQVYDFMPTASGNKYVGSNGTWGKSSDYDAWKFCRLAASESDTSIESLGAPLNSPGFNGDFFIAKDESYMIISAKEQKDFECELYISFRQKNNQWTVPVSLGKLINEGPAHRFGQYVTPDQKYLFYTHATSEKDCAIYWVRFDQLLKQLLPQIK